MGESCHAPRNPFQRERCCMPPREFNPPAIMKQILPGLLALDEGLSELPRIEESWIVSLASVPGSIRGEDRDLKAAVIVDCASELILATDIVLAGGAGGVLPPPSCQDSSSVHPMLQC